MVRSYNSSPYTSQSLAISWLHEGSRYIDIPIKLVGDYLQKEGMVKLVWETGKVPTDTTYYYCVFRKTSTDKRFKYMYNVSADNPEFTDSSLSEGEEAEYYVSIRFADGRESRESNVVKVKR